MLASVAKSFKATPAAQHNKMHLVIQKHIWVRICQLCHISDVSIEGMTRLQIHLAASLTLLVKYMQDVESEAKVEKANQDEDEEDDN